MSDVAERVAGQLGAILDRLGEAELPGEERARLLRTAHGFLVTLADIDAHRREQLQRVELSQRRQDLDVALGRPTGTPPLPAQFYQWMQRAGADLNLIDRTAREAGETAGHRVDLLVQLFQLSPEEAAATVRRNGIR